jgi:hypothetical protein
MSTVEELRDELASYRHRDTSIAWAGSELHGRQSDVRERVGTDHGTRPGARACGGA